MQGLRAVGTQHLVSNVAYPGYCGQNSLTAHFGLGVAENVDEIRVKFLGGQDTIFTSVGINQLLEITENQLPNDTQSFENERFVVNVFPNPTTDTFRISIENLKLNASLNLRISDPTGRVVFEEKYGKMDGHFKGDFSKKNLGLGNGIHFLTLESDGVSRVITLK